MKNKQALLYIISIVLLFWANTKLEAQCNDVTLTLTGYNPSCPDNGSIKVAISGPDAVNIRQSDMQFQVSGTVNWSWSTYANDSIPNLFAGTYTIALRAFCFSVNDYVVFNTSATTTLTSSYIELDVVVGVPRSTLNCKPTGMIPITIMSNTGSPPFTTTMTGYPFDYTGPKTFVTTLRGTPFQITDLTAGTYTFTVSDNCSYTKTVSATVNAMPSDYEPRMIYDYIYSPQTPMPGQCDIVSFLRNYYSDFTNDQAYYFYTNSYEYYQIAFLVNGVGTPVYMDIPTTQFVSWQLPSPYSIKWLRDNNATISVYLRIKDTSCSTLLKTVYISSPDNYLSYSDVDCDSLTVNHYPYNNLSGRLFCYPYQWRVVRSDNSVFLNWSDSIYDYSTQVARVPYGSRIEYIDNEGYTWSKSVLNNPPALLYGSGYSPSLSYGLNPDGTYNSYLFIYLENSSIFPIGTRIEFISGPKTPVHDDVTISSIINQFFPFSTTYTSLTFEDIPAGIYQFRVTFPGCPARTVSVYHTNSYILTPFSYTTKETCGGLYIFPSGQIGIRYYDGSLGTFAPYYKLFSVVPSSIPIDGRIIMPGDSLYLPTTGEYRFGINYQNTGTAIAWEDTLFYTQTPFTLDPAKTAAYVCEDAGVGFIRVAGMGGSGHYAYELYDAGIPTPVASNTTGVFNYGIAGATYTVRLIDTDPACAASYDQTVYMLDLGIAQIAYSSSSTNNFCLADSIYLKCLTLGETTYTWTGPGITSANEHLQNPAIFAGDIGAGTHTFTVTVTPEGCGHQMVQTLTVTVMACGETWEIWNWDDLSKVMEKQALGYADFVVMQDIGIPGQPATFGDAFSNPACPWAGTNAAYGWYGYEGVTVASAFGSHTLPPIGVPAHGWDAEGWKPMGTYISRTSPDNIPFTGLFDGNGKTITGLWINRADPAAGLFALVGGDAYIHDLTVVVGRDVGSAPRQGIVSTSTTSNDNATGGVVAIMFTGNPVLENLTVSGGTISGYYNVGGIIGDAVAGTLTGTFINEATITGSGSWAGGIAGDLYDSASGAMYATVAPGSILDNRGFVKGLRSSGGIVGCYGGVNMPRTFSGLNNLGGNIWIKNSGAVGELGYSTSNMGGVFGFSESATIKDYINTVPISGESNCGGIIGTCCGNTIQNCANKGDITTTFVMYIGTVGYSGGIVGDVYFCDSSTAPSLIAGCYNVGHITGPFSGGIMGTLARGATVTNVYNLGSLTGNDCGGIVGTISGGVQSILLMNAYNAGRMVTPGSKGVIGTFDTSGGSAIVIGNLYFDRVTSGVIDGGHPAVAGMITSLMTGMSGMWRSAPWSPDIPGFSTYPHFEWQIAGDARDNLGFFAINPSSNNTVSSLNATIDLTGVPNPAKYGFNTFATTSAGYYQPLTTSPALNTLPLSPSFVTVGVTPVSVGVKSESDIVAFNIFGLPDIELQFLNCSAVDTIDVSAWLPMLPCDFSSLTLSVTSPSAQGATVTVVNKKIVYALPNPNFTGADTVYYSLNCGNGVFDGQANLNFAECPDNIIDSDCYDDPPTIVFGIKELARSSQEVSIVTSPISGDIDGDGEIELLVMNQSGPNDASAYSDAILIFGFHKTTKSLYLKYRINVPAVAIYACSPLAIAKVDGRAYPSIFYASFSNSTLYKYDFNGTVPSVFPSTTSWSQSWTRNYTTNASYRIVAPVVADIMGNGRTQVAILNRIIDTQSGNIIAEGTGMIPASGRSTYSFGCFGHNNSSWGYESSPVVIDIDGDGIQEVIAGDCVYGVNLVNFDNLAPDNSFTLKQRASAAGHPEIGDGGTAVADMDNDGLLEVVVTGPIANDYAASGTAMLCIYNPRTGAVIHTNTITDIPRVHPTSSGMYGPSRPFVGDFDDDGYPEIALTGVHTLRSYKYVTATQQLVPFWTLPTTDDSGATTLTVFNFAQDGKNRLVYRDETQLRIIDGSHNPPVVDAFFNNVESPTVNEFPIIADVNGDGAAEIIVTARDISATPTGWNFRGELRVYGSDGLPWAPARSVWNQSAYNAVNVNEDLTIPKQPLSPAIVLPGADGILGTPDDVRPYNGFLMQQTMLDKYGVPLWLLPDVAPVLSECHVTMTGNTMTISLRITNIGDAAIGEPVHVTLYKDNIAPSNMILSEAVPIKLNAGDSATVVLTIPDIMLYHANNSIIVRLNDNGAIFPVQNECDTDNNVVVLPLMKKDAYLNGATIFDNGKYGNPVSVLYTDVIKYELTATNPGNIVAMVSITDTLPLYLKYLGAISPGGTIGATSTTPQRDIVRWNSLTVAAGASQTVSYEATPVEGVSISQPMFINSAWITLDLTPYATNETYHQGAGAGYVTFLTSLGGSIYNADMQAVDYSLTPKSGVIIAPDEGYRFAGWSHDAYISLRGEKIPAKSGIMRYDTLTIYGNVSLRANFVPDENPVRKGDETVGEQPVPEEYLIWTVGNELFIKTSKLNAIVRIYSLDGILQKQQIILHAGETKIKLPDGIYVVTLNNGIGQKIRISSH